VKWSTTLRRRWFGGRAQLADDSLLPEEFLPVVRALNDGDGEVQVVAAVASDYARAGECLSHLLDDLHATYRALGRARPRPSLVRSASEAWAESMLSRLGDISCEDPLTGLATANHVRLRLAELYRSSRGSAGETYRLLEVLVSCSSLGGRSPGLEGAFQPELQLAVVGHAIRTVLPRTDTIASLGRHAVLAIARDSDCVDSSVQELARRAQDHLSSGYSASVRVKPLPGSLSEAKGLIDQLSRCPTRAGGASARPISCSPPRAVTPTPHRRGPGRPRVGPACPPTPTPEPTE